MRSSWLLTLPFLATLCSALAQEVTQTFRVWTDSDRRTVEAAFIRTERDAVVLKRRNGSEFSAPIASLSETDRDWISAQSKPSVAASLPPAEKDWPRTVTLQTTPAVEIIREDKEKKEFIYETNHYQFVCDSPLGANLVREFSRIFEATWFLNCVLPLDFKPAPENGRKKFRARIYTFEDDYATAGGPQGSAGVYMGDVGELRLPLSSLGVKMFGSRVVVDYASENYATLIHEITHQMMCHWIPKLPLWYVEGAAEYTELASYDNGRFSFLQPEKRLRSRLAPGGDFPMLHLEKLMNLRGREWLAAVGSGYGADINYASALALAYYFYHIDGDGKGTHFKDYIRAMEKLDDNDDETPPVKEHLLRGRSYEELEKDVQKGLRRAGITVIFVD